MSFVRDFLCKNFPEIEFRILGLTEVMVPVHGGGFQMFTTHPNDLNAMSLMSGPSTMFCPPDGSTFVAIGILAKGGGEELVVQWVEGNRKFWLRTRYMSTFSSEMDDARGILQKALARWDSGEAVVGYSGSMSYNSQSDSWGLGQ